MSVFAVVCFLHGNLEGPTPIRRGPLPSKVGHWSLQIIRLEGTYPDQKGTVTLRAFDLVLLN